MEKERKDKDGKVKGILKRSDSEKNADALRFERMQ